MFTFRVLQEWCMPVLCLADPMYDSALQQQKDVGIEEVENHNDGQVSTLNLRDAAHISFFLFPMSDR